MIRDRHQFRAQPAFVMVYCLYGNQNDYTLIGEGLFQVVTDQYMFQYEHYVEVTDKATGEIFLRSRLQRTNQYERQKSTVIAWSDPEQDVQNHIGISFQDQKTCDMNWRLLCSKIGKNYLEINGREKLDIPNQGNVRVLVQKIRTSYNLVAYHIINSQDFMNAFWQTLSKLSSKELPLNGIRILRQLLSNYDPKIMTIILSDPNFSHFLQIYQHECNINFRSYYNQSSTTTNVITQDLVKLNEPALNSIQLALRAKFVKQCVIDYGKDLMVANMLGQVIRDSQTQALIDMIKDGYIEKIVKVCKNSRSRSNNSNSKDATGQNKDIKEQDKEEHKSHIEQQHLDQDNVTKKLLAFFLQAAWIIRLYHIDNTKVIFLNQFYSLGMLTIIGEMINQGNFKALQVLSCIAQLDSSLFLTQFINGYRNDPANSIVRKIGKQFSESPLQQFTLQTISFFRSLIIPMQQSKPTFQFINKTITFVIFSCCKHPQRILPLVNFYIGELGAVRAIFEHIMKFKYFQSIAEKLAEINRKGKENTKMLFNKQEIISKSALLQIIRVLRSVLELNRPEIPEKEQQKKQQKNKKKQKQKIKQIRQSPEIVTKINNYVIDSKLFPQCLSYLLTNLQTNNIITSAIMQLLQILSTLPLNPLTLYIQSSFLLDKQQIGGQRLEFLLRFVGKIKEIRIIQEDTNHIGRKNSKQLGDTRKRVHQSVLDQQQQQKYLQKEDINDRDNQQQKSTHEDEKTEQMRNIELQANMKKLIQIKTEIASKEEEDEQAKRKKQMKDRMDKLKAQKKSQDTIGFNLQEFEDENQKQ